MSDINEDVPPETETLNNETDILENETETLNNETETLNNETEQPTKPKPKHIPPINKKRERLPPAKLSTVERNKILYDYDRGVYDPVWEVVITKTNKKIVRRRKIPLTQPEPKSSHESVVNSSTPQTSSLPQTSTPPSNKDWMASIQYYNVQNSFNEQLMKQIDELNNKITHQNNKHKKLKEIQNNERKNISFYRKRFCTLTQTMNPNGTLSLRLVEPNLSTLTNQQKMQILTRPLTIM